MVVVLNLKLDLNLRMNPRRAEKLFSILRFGSLLRAHAILDCVVTPRQRANAEGAQTGETHPFAGDESHWPGQVRLSPPAHPAPRKIGDSKKLEKPGERKRNL
jgi:hypothetical protein